MTSSAYKTCAVPLCESTSIKTPDKLFIHVPQSPDLRKKWLHLARRDFANVSPKYTMYFCEDHFDLKNDMENYMEFKIMGSVGKNRMKPNCLPTKFACQQNRRKRTATSSDTTQQVSRTSLGETSKTNSPTVNTKFSKAECSLLEKKSTKEITDRADKQITDGNQNKKSLKNNLLQKKNIQIDDKTTKLSTLKVVLHPLHQSKCNIFSQGRWFQTKSAEHETQKLSNISPGLVRIRKQDLKKIMFINKGSKPNDHSITAISDTCRPIHSEEIIINEEHIEDIKIKEEQIENSEITEVINAEHIKDIKIKEEQIENSEIIKVINAEHMKDIEIKEKQIENSEITDNMNAEHIKDIEINEENVENSEITEVINAEHMKDIEIIEKHRENSEITDNINAAHIKDIEINEENVENSEITEVISAEHMKDIEIKEEQIQDSEIIEVINAEHMKDIEIKEEQIQDSEITEVINTEHIKDIEIKEEQIQDSEITQIIDAEHINDIEIKEENIVDSEITDIINVEDMENFEIKEEQIEDSEMAEVIKENHIEHLVGYDNNIKNNVIINNNKNNNNNSKQDKDVDNDDIDANTVFATNLMLQMRDIGREQKIIAQKLISDVVFLAHTNQLNLTSFICINIPVRNETLTLQTVPKYPSHDFEDIIRTSRPKDSSKTSVDTSETEDADDEDIIPD